MECDLIRLELPGFHFGEGESANRQNIEAHLAACPACLGAYFALKRAAESDELRPSEAARNRLRAAVLHELAGERSRAWSAWERPVAVALALCAVLVASATVSAIASNPRPPLQITALDPTDATPEAR